MSQSDQPVTKNGKHKLKPEVPLWHKTVLTLTEASALTGLDPYVILMACHRNEVTHTKTKRQEKMLVSRRSVEEWVEEMCRSHEVVDVAAAREYHHEWVQARKKKKAEAVAG